MVSCHSSYNIARPSTATKHKVDGQQCHQLRLGRNQWDTGTHPSTTWRSLARSGLQKRIVAQKPYL